MNSFNVTCNDVRQVLYNWVDYKDDYSNSYSQFKFNYSVTLDLLVHFNVSFTNFQHTSLNDRFIVIVQSVNIT